MNPQQAQYAHLTTAQRSPPPQQVTAAQALLIDPQLMGPGPAPTVQNNSHTNGQINGQTISRAEEGDSESKPHESVITPISAASQAPTIGALVNGNSDANADTGEKKEQNREQQGIKGPSGSKENTAPQDIPSEKLAFREDKRVVNQLNKVFAA
jgi:hypothetical protein